MKLILKCKSLKPNHPLEIDINQEINLSLLESIDSQLQDFGMAVIDTSTPVYIEKFHLGDFNGEGYPPYAVPKLSVAGSFKFIELYRAIQTLTTIVKKNFNDERELAIAKMCASLEVNNNIDYAVNNINDEIVSIVKSANMSRSKAEKFFFKEKVQQSIKNAVEAKLDALTIDLLQQSLDDRQAMNLFYSKHYQFNWLGNSDFYYITAR